MRSSIFAAWLATAMLLSANAHAYRPFDQTDADVVELGTVEVELGPIALERSRDELSLVAPALIFNYGIWPRFELVVEGKNQRLLRPTTDPRWRPQDIAVSLKTLVRRGSVQGETGPSIALEPSVLLPGRGQEGVGGQVGIILSVLGTVGALHLNLVPAMSRAHEAAGSLGIIAEGPHDWRVRPVGEGLIYDEVGANRLLSGLAGFIARESETLSFDGALRAERTSGRTAVELRLGLTWAFGT
jgi:hypothetical protein